MNIMITSDLADLFGNDMKSNCELLTMLAESAYNLSLEFQVYELDFETTNEYCIIESLKTIRGVTLRQIQNDLAFNIRNYEEIPYYDLIENTKYEQGYRELEFSKKNKRKW